MKTEIHNVVMLRNCVRQGCLRKQFRRKPKRCAVTEGCWNSALVMIT